MALAPFDAQVEELEGGVRAVTVRGELDMNTAPDLAGILDDIPSDESALVLLDLSKCEFIDSTGIALVVRAWQRIDRDAGGEGKGHLVLCSVNHQVHRLLRITGVVSSVSMHEERESALAELRSAE